MKCFRHLFPLLVVFTSLPPPASAQHSVLYLGPLDAVVDSSLYSPVTLDCSLGRRTTAVQYSNPGTWGEPFYFPGHGTVITPWLSDCPCTAGYFFHTIHLVFACTEPAGCQYDLQIDLLNSCRRDEPRCVQWWPWSEDAPRLLVQGSLPGPGYYEMTITTNGWGCAFPDYWYGFTFSTFAQQQGIQFALDNIAPMESGDIRWWTIGGRICQSISEMPGSIIAWADVVCCEVPVDTAQESWGSVKALYR